MQKIRKKLTSLDTTKKLHKYFCETRQIIDTDVLIIGGGVTGLSLASALKKSDFFKNQGKITIVDNPAKINPEAFIYKPGRIPDARVISLTPASIRFLRSIGLWSHLDERLVKYVRGMQIWENKGSSYVNMDIRDHSILDKFLNFFDSNQTHPDYLCALVEINHLLSGFNKLLKDVDLLPLQLSQENIEIENTDEYVFFNIKSQGESKYFRTKLLVASDGAKSIVRNKLNISTKGYEYGETGLVCTLKGNKACDIAYQRFLHNGIFALLPLYDDLFSIVCSMPKNLNESLKALDEDSFLQTINGILHNPSESDLLSNKLDRLISINNNFSSPPVITQILSKRFEYPLQLLYATDNVVKNTVLIGDAAHVIHPLAGQGLNLGIADSAILADKIVEGLKMGRRLNDKRTLDSFSFDSGLNSKMMIGTVEMIKSTFLPSNWPISEIRNMGMSLCNKSSIIKSLLITAASGEGLKTKKFAWDNQ
jgi:ubiquinone biosynthesis monooxygenase Coq6